MPNNTQLSVVLQMLKAELAYNLTEGVALGDDRQLCYLISNKQKFLAANFDWPFLEARANVNLVAGDRYLNLPAGVDFDRRPVKAEVLWTTFYRCVEYGIDSTEYNYLNSDQNNSLDPVQRWRRHSETQFEVWPVPVTAQTLRFTGQRPLTDLQNADGTFNLVASVDLDDILVVLFVAADKLMARKDPQAAQLKLSMAQARLNNLRSSSPTRSDTLVLGGHSKERHRRTAPLILVHG